MIFRQLPYKNLFISSALILLFLVINSLVIVPLSYASEETVNTREDTSYASEQNTSNAEEILSFENDTQREIYEQLIIELRCPKCQNQNIADSNADIAQDLRKKVYEMALQNKSKTEIKKFMLDRFGEFVLYKPQFAGKTLLLWIGPILLLFAVIFFVARLILRNAALLNEEEPD